MDELRYDDPEAAIRHLRGRAEEIPEPLISRYLAVCGSSHRSVSAQRDAKICLRGAAARNPAGDDAAFADILQRWAYLVGDTGAYARALETIERATGIFVRLRDDPGIGKTLVDQGKFLYHCNRISAAVEAELLALELLPESLPHSRLAANQHLSVFFLEGKDRQRALSHARTARRLAQQCGRKRPIGRLSWSESRICKELGQLDESALALARALEILGPIDPLDGLLITAELVQLHALRHRSPEAIQVARGAVDFMGGVEGSSVAEAAIVELYKAATGEGLKLRSIERIIEDLNAAASSERTTDHLGDRLRRAYVRLEIRRKDAARCIGLSTALLERVEKAGAITVADENRIQSWLDERAPEILIATE